jgi:hypothetical protein
VAAFPQAAAAAADGGDDNHSEFRSQQKNWYANTETSCLGGNTELYHPAWNGMHQISCSDEICVAGISGYHPLTGSEE